MGSNIKYITMEFIIKLKHAKDMLKTKAAHHRYVGWDDFKFVEIIEEEG